MFGFRKKLTPAPDAPTITSWSTTLEPVSAPAPTPEPRAFGHGWGGSKFPGGIIDDAEDWLFTLDYWTLRHRSSQVFHKNLYARGIINRLITNEINKGLAPESHPLESATPFDEDTLSDWADDCEDRFELWANDPLACDYKGERTFGQLQELARLESLVGGDCLVILRPGKLFNMPTVQVVRGDKVTTPLKQPNDADIVDGIEYDSRGREVAYWVDDQRVAAYGRRSRRRTAFMIHGPRRRADQKRGEPILSVILQSLKELDKYRDNALRKAVVSSLLAIFIKKDEAKPGTQPFSATTVRRDEVPAPAGNAPIDPDRQFDLSSAAPGIVIQELQHGETPQAMNSDGTDINLPVLEDAIVSAMAWVLELPPEIAKLAFTNNYSASQAAINEFKMYLDRVWYDFGVTMCAPVWRDWLITDALALRMNNRIGSTLLDAFRNPAKRQTFNALCAVEFFGNVKPSTDMLKQVRGSAAAIREGLTTRTRESRMIRGTSYRRNMRVQEREVLAMRRVREILEPEGQNNGGANAYHHNNVDADREHGGDDDD